MTYYYVSHQPIHHPSQRAYGTVDPRVQPPPTRPDAVPKSATPQQQGAGGSSQEPPTYAEAVKGDNKMQTQG